MASNDLTSKNKDSHLTVLKPKSLAWKLFKIDDKNDSKAICQISRGSKSGCYTTTNVLKHLKTKHSKEVAEEDEKKKIMRTKDH